MTTQLSRLISQGPVIMGILNLTPDSFFDGGKYLSELQWMKQAEKLVSEGAAVVDIGAVSTRPGAAAIDVKDELSRIAPVVRALSREFPEVILSVDTWRSEVAAVAVAEGATLINDISGGTFDAGMFSFIRSQQVDYVLMHTPDVPSRMQLNPSYDDVVADVRRFLFARASALSEGYSGQIVLDPGFGFGKTIEHNYELLQRLREITTGEWPVLVGVSRKSMIYKLLDVSPEEALNGTSALNLFAILQGAAILRVHDVKQACEVVKIASMLAPSSK